MALLTPGTTSTGTPAGGQIGLFFAAAAKDERVATLEPHDAGMLVGLDAQQLVDLVLAQGMEAGALAGEDQLGTVRRLVQERRVDQGIVDYGAGAAQRTQAA